MLILEIPGEIDSRLITTMGVNVKETRSPIGYFGTGLKYGIAVALRHGCTVTIQSGLRTWTFSTSPETIRGKDFQLIQMHEGSDSRQLAFTLDLGKNWKPWMAYREFHCNCLDEGGTVREAETAPALQPNLTRVILDGEPMIQAYRNRHEWLLQSEPMFTSTECNIHRASSKALFYRGIKVCDLPKTALHTYNIQANVTLSEDRTAASYSLMGHIVQALATDCTDTLLLKSVLMAQKTFEAELNWGWCFGRPSETFIQVINELYESHPATMSQSALRMAKDYIKVETPRSVVLTKVESMMLAKALRFLAKLGHRPTHEIIVMETLGHQSILGLARDEKILIPRATFGKGTKYLASTLLEEHLHLTHGMTDCSRELQNWLFDRVVSLGEELQGEPL